MLRVLPWSLLGHVLVLGLFAVVGGQVSPPPVDARHAIRVRLGGPTGSTAGRAGAGTLAPAARPPKSTPAAPPPAAPGTRKVPRQEQSKRQEPPKRQTPAGAKGRAPDPGEVKPKNAASEGVAGGQAGGTGATLPGGSRGAAAGGTDQPFPFAWYLTLVEGQVSRNWNPAQLGFGTQAQRRAVVHFVILSDGTITEARVRETSGVSVFDREALRAVAAANPLPPLPRGFPARSLGVSFIFTLRSSP